MYKRMDPEDRKESILEAALHEAQRVGFSRFRLVDVATKAECSNASVLHYWSTMKQIRRSVMRLAIKREVLTIIALGIALDDPSCRKLPADLRARAVASI